LRGVQSGDALRGTWAEEGGSRGTMELRLAADGLRFEGRASSADETYEWNGKRSTSATT
jgi:hypothetical protein